MCTSDKQLVLFVHIPNTNLFAGCAFEQACSNLLMSFPMEKHGLHYLYLYVSV